LLEPRDVPTFRCNLSKPEAPAQLLPHHWEYAIGSGHAALGLRADWQAQLCRCHRELGVRHVRFHGLLDDSMQVVVKSDDALEHRFQTVDRVYDAIVGIGMRPLVELGFMPGPIASGSETVFRYAANVTKPRSWDEWTDLIGGLFRHFVDRYGLDEVSAWPVEIWNEPNQPRFWVASQADYFELYRRTAAVIKQVDPAIQVGGPVTSKGAWIEAFLAAAQRDGAPVDFVSTHFYASDASDEGSTRDRLRAADRGWMRELARDAATMAQGLPLYYTEWNSSSDDRDPLHDQPYNAAFVARTALRNAGIIAGSSFWTFSDLFVEHGTPAAPYYGGFGLLNQYGVPKPSYRAFELLHELGDELLASDGMHTTVDAWFTRDRDQIGVLLSNHAQPGAEIRDESVELCLVGGDAPCGAIIRRVDADHANPRAVWEQIGAPTYPDDATLALLESASAIGTAIQPFEHSDGVTTIRLRLPAHGLALVRLDGSIAEGVGTRAGTMA
jgi:xylan 1,4-beta-xylosidase